MGEEGADQRQILVIGEARRAAALITALAYIGSFCLFSSIAPLLIKVMGMAPATVGTKMLVYGVVAAIGNVVGGVIGAFGLAATAIVAGIAALSVGDGAR